MKKIAYILHGLASGGTEAFVMNVVSRLDKKDYDITFILALDCEGGQQFREAEALELGVHIFRTCDLNGLKKKYLHYKKTVEILKENGPFDVVHANMDLFNGINLRAAKKAGVPIRICHSHNSESQYATSWIKKSIVRFYRAIMRNMIGNNATLKLGCSEIACEYLYGKKYLQQPNCKVLYNGIDLLKYQNSGRNKEYLIKNGIPLAKYNLITVGRFAPQKNPEFIVDILAELKKRQVDFHFTWVGKGSLKNQIMDKVKKENLLEQITVLEERNDVAELLKCQDAFIFPSLFEGFGIVLLEAQAAGVVCLVSDSVIKEIDLGLCKYLSLTKSACDWANELLNIVQKGNNKSLDVNRMKQFDICVTVDKLREYYGEL